MGHDQLFKDFLRTFFRDFLELFYPDTAERLNFGRLQFLDKEFFTDFPVGDPRQADLVAHIRTHEGTPELILVHIEVQWRPEREFAERMFQYYALLWLRHRTPIFPVAVVLSGGRQGLTEGEYRLTLFGRERLRFLYETVELAKLDAQEYLDRGNPVGAALAALMRRERTADTLTLRALMLQRVAESALGDAQKFLLVNLIETYFTLNAKETESFRRLLGKAEFREARKMEVTWADKIREEGRQEGHQKGHQEGHRQGLIEGKRDNLRILLTKKFGPLTDQTMSRVNAIESPAELDVLLERVLTASSLKEMGLGS